MSGRSYSTEEIVAFASTDPDLRILRRAVAPQPIAAPRGALLLACCAVEGIRLADGDRLRSLSLRPFRTDVDGSIVQVGTPRLWTSSRVVAKPPNGGCESACDAEAASLLLDAEIIVAHDARATRPLVERTFATAVGRPWICTLRDVDWPAMGLEPGTLPDALRQTGRFLGSDDPKSRVDGLLGLLTHRASPSTNTLLGEILASACRPTWFVEVDDLPPAGEKMVAAAGYVLIPGSRRWWRELDGERVDREVDWLTRQVCADGGLLRVRRIDWRTRHTVH